MRLLFDLIGAQTDGSRIRGIGRYTRSLALAMQKLRADRDVQFALSASFPQAAADLQAELSALAPGTRYAIYKTPHTARIAVERTAGARRLGEAIYASMVAEQTPDVYLASSLFECWQPDFVLSDLTRLSTPVTACIVYDFIPAIFPGLYLRDPAYKIFYEQQMQAVASADVLLAISDSARADAMRLLSVPGERIVNISGAADSCFRPVPVDSQRDAAQLARLGLREKFIFCAAGDDPRKNAQVAVDAYLALDERIRRDYQLVMLVPFPDEKKRALKQQMQKSGMNESDLVFLSRIDDDDLTFLYARCALFLFPSLYEGFGLPALEAMQSGAAVLVGDNSSQREIVDRADLRCDAASPVAVALAMQPLLTNREFRAQAQAWGLARAKKFTWEETARRTCAALEEALANKTPRSPRALPASLRLAEGLEAQVASILTSERPASSHSKYQHISDLAEDIMISCPALYTGTRRRLLIDVTAIATSDQRTGIQRVVRNITASLYREQNLGDVLPVAVRLQDDRLIACQSYVGTMAGAPSPLTDAAIDILPGDHLLMLDNAWEDFIRFSAIFKHIQSAGGKVISCIYDLIPQLYRGASVGRVPEVHAAWLKAAVQDCDGIIAISQTVAQELVDYIASQQLSIRPGLTIGWFHCGSDITGSSVQSGNGTVSQKIKKALAGPSPVFLIVGTIEPRKGHKTALEAFEQLWKEGIEAKLVFIGRKGWHVDVLLGKITGHTAYGRTLFWFDKADDNDLEYAYTMCTAVLSPSYAEGFGLPLAEAAAHKKPVICSDIPVFREIGRDGALYFRVSDPLALAMTVHDLLDGAKAAHPERIIQPTWRDAALRIVDVVMNDQWLYRL